jgi:adenosylhomocysteinase
MGHNEDLAFQAEREVGLINAFFPILPLLGNRWAASRPWEGLTVALNMHITTLTAALARELTLGGGTFVLSAASPATTDPGSVQFLRNLGLDVYTGGDMENRHLQVLSHQPQLLIDVGFELVQTLLDKHAQQASTVRGAIEVTRTGITRLRRRTDLPFPVVNINDGRLKEAVENRHGVGQAIWEAVSGITKMHLAGRRATVVGYGPVGRGLAIYARNSGMAVEVVERDPVRRLFAHYDGFPTPVLGTALSRAEVVVTATGKARVVTPQLLMDARDGIVLVNAGHGGDEIDVGGIRAAAVREDNISDDVVRFRLRDGPRVTVLGGGHPLNIVLNAGSPEPVLLHFAVAGLTLETLVETDAPPGEVPVPDEIENQAATLALRALGAIGA